MNGVTMTVKVAHLRLCHSRMFIARAYPRETLEMVFDAHERAFTFTALFSQPDRHTFTPPSGTICRRR
jgi:transposase